MNFRQQLPTPSLFDIQEKLNEFVAFPQPTLQPKLSFNTGQQITSALRPDARQSSQRFFPAEDL